MDKNIQERIRRIVETVCGGNNSEFCRRIGKPNTAVKDIIGGKGTAPGYDFLYSVLSSDLGISPMWLMVGEGDMLVSEDSRTQSATHKVVLHDIHDNPIVNINYLQDAIKGAIKEAYREIQNERP